MSCWPSHLGTCLGAGDFEKLIDGFLVLQVVHHAVLDETFRFDVRRLRSATSIKFNSPVIRRWLAEEIQHVSMFNEIFPCTKGAHSFTPRDF